MPERLSSVRLLAGLASLSLAAAPAAARPCLQPASVRDLMVVLAPGLIEEMDRVCTKAGKPSFLADPQIKRFSDRAKSAGDALLPGVIETIDSFASTPPPAVLNDEVKGMMIRSGVSAALVAERLKADSCEPARDLVRSLSALEPVQAGEIVAGLYILSGAKGPPVCRP